MKILFLMLLLGNLGWFAWSQWLAPAARAEGGAAPARARAAPVGAGRIQLVGEAGAEDSPRAAAAAGLPQCLAVGPFRDAAAVGAALEYFERHGHAPRVRPGPEFWVEIRVDAPVAPDQTPRALFWEHPDMTTTEHAAMGDPEAWRFAPCEPQAQQPEAG
jgi:hypothetical protein